MSVYTTTWSEARVLDYFWMMVNADADRIALLQQLAGVAVQRPPDWDRAAERAAPTPRGKASICFSCFTGDRRLYWHHVIAIQHGGSTWPQNFVPICLACHARIHPWLDTSHPERERRGVSSWTRVGDMIVAACEETILREETTTADQPAAAPSVRSV